MNKRLTTRTLPGFLRDRGVGFDQMFDMLDEAVGYAGSATYPPYNLIKESDSEYTIEVAVAGFSIDDIEITQNGNKLFIEGNQEKEDEQEVNYMHRGISSRSFNREFILAEHVTVSEAAMQDGILRVKMLREVPDEMKPRKINIDVTK